MNQATLVTLTDALTLTFLLSVGAFVLAMLLTPFYTFAAYRYKFWKKQRSTSVDGEKLAVFNRLHASKIKRNIPTMAGVIGVMSITVITLIFNRNRAETWLPLAALLGGGAVGILDDILNVRGQDAKVAGMRAGVKFTMITTIAIVLGMFFFSKLGYTTVHIPFLGDLMLGWLIVPLFAFAVVATSNAVNISDGLDGLAGGLLAVSFGTFGIIALLQGQVFLAGFCYTVVGALLSYLWFNIYPARFFMGDAGSFAFGTCLGVIAMMTNTLFLLPIIGAVFVVEAGSSLVQIISKRVWHRKIFVSAPLHHHLEATGWPEVKVTMRFWVIGCITSFMGVLLALLGGHI
jgi:phospho-N-acetylmuramoyl-pentapeptide-transferase